MSYVSGTFKYFKKALPLLSLIMVIPAVTMGFFMRPLSFFTFLPHYMRVKVNSFLDVMWLIFNKYSLTYVYPIILIFILMVVSVSLCVSIIEKHFKTGRLMIKAPLRDINNSLFPVLKSLFFLFIAYIAWKFLFVCIVTLIHMLISGAGRTIAIDLIVTAVLSIGLFMLFFRFALLMVFSTPLMLLFGYSYTDSLIASSAMMSKSKGKVYFGAILPFIIVLIVESVAVFLKTPQYAMVIINSISYLFLMLYTVVYVMIAAFDLSDMERRDLKKLY